MKFDLKFSENAQRLDLGFGQFQDLTDGGYERGYAEGYDNGLEKGYADGQEEGYERGNADGQKTGAQEAVTAVINKTLVELVNNEITSVVQYLFDGNKNLQKVVSNSLASVGISSFANCPNLFEVDCPKITSVGTRGFAYSGIKSIHFPVLGYVGNSILLDNVNLEYARFDVPTTFSALCFSGCVSLKTFVITRSSVCPLQNIDCFANTPIANGTGYVYVPDNLVEQYKVATNWVTYADQIKPLSELEG